MTFWYGEGRYFPDLEIVRLEDDYVVFYLIKAVIRKFLEKNNDSRSSNNGYQHG
jgi:hypothetical protein